MRTAWAASKSLNDGLNVAFSSGSIMGMAVVSFSIIGLTTLYLIFNNVMGLDPATTVQYLTGFGFGASSIRALRPCRWRHLYQGC